MPHPLIRLLMLAVLAVPCTPSRTSVQASIASTRTQCRPMARCLRARWPRGLGPARRYRPSTPLQPGQRVADVGAGSGFFSMMMAREVGPGGLVYAVDIAANFVDASVQRAQDAGLHNVRGVVNDQRGTGLPADSVDLVFISDTYHHSSIRNPCCTASMPRSGRAANWW